MERPENRRDNAGVNLPDKDIRSFIVRTERTTAVFNQYLSKVSPDWTIKGQNITLPQASDSARAHAGVMGQVKQRRTHRLCRIDFRQSQQSAERVD